MAKRKSTSAVVNQNAPAVAPAKTNHGAVAINNLQVVTTYNQGEEIVRLREENRKLRVALDADEIARLREENLKLQAALYVEKDAGLREENHKLRAALDAVTDEAATMARYYDNLVWLARLKGEPYPTFYDKVKAELGERCFRKFLRDKESLSDPEACTIKYGFFLGCLGSARLFRGLSTWEDHTQKENGNEISVTAKQEREYALGNFPDLDT